MSSSSDERLERQRHYDAKHRDKRLRQMKEYRAKHRDRQREYKQEWYRRNRDLIKQKRLERKAAKPDAATPPSPLALLLSLELSTHAPDEANTFFREGSSSVDTARAVLIDMEPKVVLQCHARAANTGRWVYDKKNHICQQSGSGNNWAYGYTVHGSESAERVFESVQREVEHCDYFKGFHAMQSLAGGTGSGLGSFISDLLHDQFPHSFLLNTVVWPYHSGEVIVQNYNTLLTMACLSESSDGIFVLRNDVADKICQKLLTIPKPSLDQMNGVLANHIASVLLPAQTNDASPRCQLPLILQELCSHPGYKLMDVKVVPQLSSRSRAFSAHQWAGVLKHLHQMQIANSSLDEGVNWDISLDTSPRAVVNKSVGSLLYVRGPDTAAVAADAFLDRRMYCPWASTPCQVLASTAPFNEYDKTAALLSNSQTMLDPIQTMVEKAHCMYASRAYLHQYAAHGVDTEFFESCFLRLDQLILNYQSL
ncbi:tubulin/FtsZ family [Achlya hypogyna]|uniref:Tubulin delta chain n=1 Tax=Achlya hypogyna TaxID=1202772 RepID=A0A1V9ZME0_ACHHY|nr:tubulin/FtsZ family [Achlya hypogyna]